MGQLYCYLRVTSEVEPDLQLSESEKVFVNPKTGQCAPFPRTALSRPTLYLSLIVPAYKEEKRCKCHVTCLIHACTFTITVPKMMEKTMSYLEHRQHRYPSFNYEVIIVNDGSPDGTAQEALKFVHKYGVEKVRLLDFTKNRGKGGAVRMVSPICIYVCSAVS